MTNTYIIFKLKKVDSVTKKKTWEHTGATARSPKDAEDIIATFKQSDPIGTYTYVNADTLKNNSKPINLPKED